MTRPYLRLREAAQALRGRGRCRMTTDDYCGCCGNEIDQPGVSTYWCIRCLPHIKTDGAVWERTYFGQHRVDCPYQVGSTANRPYSSGGNA